MKRDFAGARVHANEYERLRMACQFDTTFPASFDAWQKLVREGNELADQSGEPRHEIDVDVDEFERWCGFVQVRPSLPALRAFLIIKRHGVLNALKGGAGALHPGGHPAGSRDDAMSFVGAAAVFVVAAFGVNPPAERRIWGRVQDGRPYRKVSWRATWLRPTNPASALGTG